MNAHSPLFHLLYIEHRASQHYAHTSCFLGFSLANLSVLAEHIGNVFLAAVHTSSVQCSVQCTKAVCCLQCAVYSVQCTQAVCSLLCSVTQFCAQRPIIEWEHSLIPNGLYEAFQASLPVLRDLIKTGSQINTLHCCQARIQRATPSVQCNRAKSLVQSR